MCGVAVSFHSLQGAILIPPSFLVGNPTLSRASSSTKGSRSLYPSLAMFAKTCLICEKPFLSEANNARYCSKECKQESKRRRNKASRGPTKLFNETCDRCGNPFETRVSTKKCFSQECYRLAIIERKRAKRGSSKIKVSCQQTEKVFLDLCSVCGADDVPVSECPECGYPSCEKCHGHSGTCNICLALLRHSSF